MSKATLRHTIGEHVDEVDFKARDYIGDSDTLFVKNRDRAFTKEELLAVYREAMRAAGVDNPEHKAKLNESTVKPAIYEKLRDVVAEHGVDYSHHIKEGDRKPLRKHELAAVLHHITEDL